MASTTLSLAIQLTSTGRKRFSSQPLPYVCKRCLAVLAEDKVLGSQTHSISSEPETVSNKNKPSKSKALSSSPASREAASQIHSKSSLKHRRKRVFTKKYPHDISPRDARNESSRYTTSGSLSLRVSECKDSRLRASAIGTDMKSLKEVASAYATEVVRKLRDDELKSTEKLKTPRSDSKPSPTTRLRRKSKSVASNLSTAKISKPMSDESSTIKSLDESSLGLTTPNGSITTSGMDLSAIHTEQNGVPRLAYGLDRVLFNPGVYYLKDPRSRIYNYDPYLEKIMPISEFDFSLLKDYITSSQDEALTSIAKKQNLKYMGSSSSMTGLLSHFHFVLSNWRSINVSMLSKEFPVSSTKFTRWCKAPSAIYLRYKDGAYAMDSDNTFEASNVLTYLGKSMEKLLTLSPDKYERYRKTNDNPVTNSEREKPEMYNYSSLGNILMRSQLDAYDPRLPGSGLFDLKSRAVISIRMEVNNHQRGLGYEIKHDQGQWESFEREYHDMIRATLLKYALQVRMGRMDGIFVAYHNVERIFGFQYISLDEMDLALHGQSNTCLGNQEFELSLKLLNEILDRIVKKIPKQSCNLVFEANEGSSSLDIFAMPVDDAEIQASIKKAGDTIEEVERIVRDSTKSSAEANVEEMSEKDITQDASKVTEIPDALEQKKPGYESNLPVESIDASSKDDVSDAEYVSITGEGELSPEAVNEDFNTDSEKGSKDTPQQFEENEERTGLLDENIIETGVHANNESLKAQTDKSLLGEVVKNDPNPLLLFRLHIASKVNGEHVARPERLGPNDRWDVEYRIDEIEDYSKALKLYKNCLDRKRKLVEQTKNEERKNSSTYFETIRKLSDQGRDWRQGQDAADEAVGQVVYEPYAPMKSEC